MTQSGDWQTWSWDPTLFEGAAPYYERGRLPYAEQLPSALAAALDLDGHGRLLDVGCGPGSVTLRVAHLFASVVGIDADPAMIAEARRLADLRGVGNATWIVGRGEDIGPDLGRFRVVTFAASLHWMDRPLVFGLVKSLLEDRGAVVHVDNTHQDLPRVQAVARVRRAYLGADTRAGQSVRNNSPSDEDDVFRSAGFSGPEVVVVPDGRVLERTIDDLVAENFSSSGGAPHLFGDRLAEFERDLRVALAEELGPEGVLRVTLPDNQLKIWRAASTAVTSR